MSLYFTKSHEWADVDGDIAAVGITDYAAGELGDVVYVELPEVGSAVKAGEKLCEVESVKAASEIFSPVDGVITEVNSELEDAPELINSDAMATWICKIKLDGLNADLMDEAAYKAGL